MKLCVADDRTVNFIQFKNIKIALDRDTCVFIGGIDKNNNIKVNRYVREKLLKKFKVCTWDFIDYDKDFLHIKFLVKYSPILSKFIDASEFDTVELTLSDDQIVNNWNRVSYINFNDEKEFFNVHSVSYTERDVISLEIDSEFSQILKEGNY